MEYIIEVYQNIREEQEVKFSKQTIARKRVRWIQNRTLTDLQRTTTNPGGGGTHL